MHPTKLINIQCLETAVQPVPVHVSNSETKRGPYAVQPKPVGLVKLYFLRLRLHGASGKN